MTSEMIGIILFLGGQLLANIGVMVNLGTRITRVETHLVHILEKHGYRQRKQTNLEDFDES